jgi:glycosyltransferase involved in cell wall biosynthesis
MKIGISTSVIQRGTSGIAQWVFNVSKALKPFAKEHSFTLFVLEEDLPLFDQQSNYMRLHKVAETWRHPVKDILWHQWMLPRLCKRLELDLVHIPSYRRMIWSNKCRKLTTIHDLAPYHVPGKYDMARMMYARHVIPALARRSHGMSAVSHFTANDIETFLRIPKSETTVIHNGIDHTRFHSGDRSGSKVRMAEKLGLKVPYLLYVARLEHPAKNHVRLIHAFEQIKQKMSSELELVIAGKDWHGAEKIHERIRQSPEKASIRSLGFVADEDLADLYRAAEVFVYPSLFEGFGLPPIEAMACGTPVVCSPDGALSEVVADAAEIINPLDDQSIFQGLSNVIQSKESREHYVQKGQERAKHFDWNRAAERWMDIYQKTLEKH